MWDNIDQELLRDLSALMESSRGNGNVNVEQIAMKMTMVRVMTDKILNRTAELEREKQRYVDRKNEEINSFLRRIHTDKLENIENVEVRTALKIGDVFQNWSRNYCPVVSNEDYLESRRLLKDNSFENQINQIEKQLRYYRDILSKLTKHV